MPQIITIGEALVEVMRPDASVPLDQPGVFEGPFASGAPAIFAVAASRLGMDTGFAGGVGPDGFGRLLHGRLQKENVDTHYLRTIPGYTTGIAFIAYAADGSREFIFHLRQSASAVFPADQLEEVYFADMRWLHISGSALFLSDASRTACERALALTRAAGGKLSLDPNLRPELMPINEARDVLKPFLTVADLMLPTAEEAQALTGEDDDDGAARRLLTGKNRIVAYKRGATGCTVYSPNGRIDIPGFDVVEIDPTGAGDCFNAGFLYGLEAGWSIDEAARFANAAGALAVTRQGPMEGAPKVQQVEDLIRRK